MVWATMAVAAMEPIAERAVFALANLEPDEEKTLWENWEIEFGNWLNLSCDSATQLRTLSGECPYPD